MPIGYLVTVAFVALVTLLALAPQRRPPVLGKISWLSSLLVNEVPFLAFVALPAATALAIAGGDLTSPGAWLVVGVAVLTMIGLLVIAHRGVRASPAPDDALTEALGPGWRAAIDRGLAASLRRRRPLTRILLCPWPPARVRSVPLAALRSRRRHDRSVRRLGALARTRVRGAGRSAAATRHCGR
jgi:hypothetical protein